MKRYCMRVVGTVGTVLHGDDAPSGAFLRSYDPEARNGLGVAEWTLDAAQAMTFASPADALACYRAVPKSRPRRADGRPNRPLTVFTVEVSPIETER